MRVLRLLVRSSARSSALVMLDAAYTPRTYHITRVPHHHAYISGCVDRNRRRQGIAHNLGQSNVLDFRVQGDLEGSWEEGRKRREVSVEIDR